MAVNKDEALRCLEIARNKLSMGERDASIRFTRKSLNLHSTTEAEDFLQYLLSHAEGHAATSSTEPFDKSSSKHRSVPATKGAKPEPQIREFTVEQERLVGRIRKCKKDKFYDIMDLKPEATEVEIKKAYKKLALQLHPDKNAAPRADEAFKMVSHAFQVLNNPDKRAIYDRSGMDPGARGASGSPSGFSNAFANARRNGGSPMFTEELSPEDLFNMFFGSGMGAFGSGFGGGAFGTPGIRIQTFGRAPRRQHTATQNQTQNQENGTISQVLPLLIVLLFSLLSSLFSGEWSFGGSGPSQPAFAFHPRSPYTQMRTTPRHSIHFYVDPKEINSLSEFKLSQLDKTAELAYINGLKHDCELEYTRKRRVLEEAEGWFSRDEEMYRKAKSMKTPNCQRLDELGYSLQ
ncbi:putative J domain-containing protein [Neolecta irregularis DAH-3]|uniref:Putative J domain-containing protein n=1 Tax=Neolecta irregularis (strain DAH-3) TaxID=1198029 RepID=A0A1U7LIT9_NEOID|nr:putative J domain-containing protein [Neolecta irregularis DAH-3]|eukprot:OLL22567.1 putative J domain-containing protein [Neolecta irregularis DAH-3]